MGFTFERFDKISGPMLILRDSYKDKRGTFSELYKNRAFTDFPTFVQDNYSVSTKGTIRGLHYQVAPYEQGKLIAPLTGTIYDVAVDIRKESPTFLKYISVVLSEHNGYMLYVPPGFAHGFQVLTKKTRVIYKCTQIYNKESERGILYNDSTIGITWKKLKSTLSQKDLNWPIIKNAEVF